MDLDGMEKNMIKMVILNLKLKMGKEMEQYFNDYKTKFEAEFLNGKYHGKVKEYSYDTLVFEGEYKNGKRNGKGKEYLRVGMFRSKGDLLFEGEYLDGKRWNGKEYYGSRTFEIRDGKGKGREYKDYYYNELIFEGKYINGERNGKGKEYASLLRQYVCFEGNI